MSDIRLTRRESIVAGLCLGLFGPSVLAQERAKTTTLENLQAAYNGESNANARYTAFAAKADEEGCHQVASLFRSAAKSEGYHLRNHANVLKKMGAEPKADIKAPEVKSTQENLEAAVKGETEEHQNLYPSWIKQAQEDNNPEAAQTLDYALLAEKQHAKYFAEALANLAAWKEGTKDFLVCTNCGYTTTDLSIQNCPVCGFPRAKIELVK